MKNSIRPQYFIHKSTIETFNLRVTSTANNKGIQRANGPINYAQKIKHVPDKETVNVDGLAFGAAP